MNSKPLVFLSHSKSDKKFVKKVALDLQTSGILCWYDEWEIGPGDSLRKKIFEEGIDRSELFVVYISEHSIDSRWVQEELNAGFIREVEEGGGFLTIFVTNDDIRSRLPSDLRSRSCPVFNAKNYATPIGQIVSRAWQSLYKKSISEIGNAHEVENIKLKNNIVNLEKQVRSIEESERSNVPGIISMLKAKVFIIDSKEFTLAELFSTFAPSLSLGRFTYRNIDYDIARGLLGRRGPCLAHRQEYEIASPLIILDLIKVEQYQRTVFDKIVLEPYLLLTDLGKQVVLQLGYQL